MALSTRKAAGAHQRCSSIAQHRGRVAQHRGRIAQHRGRIASASGARRRVLACRCCIPLLRVSFIRKHFLHSKNMNSNGPVRCGSDVARRRSRRRSARMRSYPPVFHRASERASQPAERAEQPRVRRLALRFARANAKGRLTRPLHSGAMTQASCRARGCQAGVRRLAGRPRAREVGRRMSPSIAPFCLFVVRLVERSRPAPCARSRHSGASFSREGSSRGAADGRP